MRGTYKAQIAAYYDKTLPTHELIQFGITPDILQKYGAPNLPLVMQQSTLTKCTRKVTGSRSAHELTRDIIEKLPEHITSPIFLIRDDERSSIALISGMKDNRDNNILIAIRLSETRKNLRVNEIKSVYGKTNLKVYLQNHIAKKHMYVIDNKKAEKLSRVLGLQLPTTLTASSYGHTIPHLQANVKQRSLTNRLHDKQEWLANRNQGGKREQSRTKEGKDER